MVAQSLPRPWTVCRREEKRRLPEIHPSISLESHVDAEEMDGNWFSGASGMDSPFSGAGAAAAAPLQMVLMRARAEFLLYRKE